MPLFFSFLVMSFFDETLWNDGQDEAMVQAAEDAERRADHQIQLGGNPGSSHPGRLRFVFELLHECLSRRFGVHERVVHLFFLCICRSFSHIPRFVCCLDTRRYFFILADTFYRFAPFCAVFDSGLPCIQGLTWFKYTLATILEMYLWSCHSTKAECSLTI